MENVQSAVVPEQSTFLSDEEAGQCLLAAAHASAPARAEMIVKGCRATARSEKKADDTCRHVLWRHGHTWRLISVAALVDLKMTYFDEPSPEQLAAVREAGSFPADIELVIGSFEDVGRLAQASASRGVVHPFDQRTICLSTRCCADHLLIADWVGGVMLCGHKNFMAYSYGAIPQFASYVFIITEVRAE